MTIGKGNGSARAMAEVSRGFVRTDIVEFFQKRIAGAGGGLENVHLGGVCKKATLRGVENEFRVEVRLRTGRGKMDIVTIAPGRTSRFQFEASHAVVQRWTDFHAAGGKIFMEGAGGAIEAALTFCTAFDPTEPVNIAAVGGVITVTERAAIVFIPIEASSETELTQIAEAGGVAGFLTSFRQDGQQERDEHRNHR